MPVERPGIQHPLTQYRILFFMPITFICLLFPAVTDNVVLDFQAVPITLLHLSASSAAEVLSECDARLDTLMRCAALPEIDPSFLHCADVQAIKAAVSWPASKHIHPGAIIWCAVCVCVSAACVSNRAHVLTAVKTHTLQV